MERIEEQLRQLGEHVEHEVAARERAAAGNSTDGTEGDGARSPFGGRGAPRRRRRDERPRRRSARFPRTVVTTAAAAVVVAAGLAVAASRDSEQPSASDPSAVPVGTAVAAPASPVVVEVPEPPLDGSDSALLYDDAELLTRLYSLLQAGTAEETDLTLNGRVPQEEIAACMAEANFQYEPEDEMAGNPRWTMQPDDFAAQYGLGIIAVETDVYPRVEDPNLAYMQSLSEGQREAYYSALRECRLGDERDAQLVFFNAESVAIQQFHEVVTADDRVIAATEAWAACMAAAGFDYDEPQQMRQSFYSALNADDLEALFAEEVAVAVANVPCEAEVIEVRRDVIASRFDEYKALLRSALDSGEVPEGQGFR